jgi:hypothetical protein
MSSNMALAKPDGDLAAVVMLAVDWQTALEMFLNTLSSPRTRQACQGAVKEVMPALAAGRRVPGPAPDPGHRGSPGRFRTALLLDEPGIASYLLAR